MTLHSIQQSLSAELGLLDSMIKSSLASDNEMMAGIINGYLGNKGKQIRPILVILTAKMLGEVCESTIAAAAAVEMLHNASLIHDDVVDESRLRHGHPTINSVWDNHIAVLVGDFFVSSALARAIDTSDIRIIRSLSSMGRLLSVGEFDQIYNARFHRLNEKEYFRIISRKTASLFVTCVEMGAYSNNITDNRLDALRRYAELLGLCFQIKDDIFDYVGSESIGKPTGNDLLEGKVTLPLLYALSRTDLPDHQAMVELSRKNTLTADDVTRLYTFARDAGGLDYAVRTMRRLRDEAVMTLNSVSGPAEVRDALVSLIDFIVARDN